MKLIFIRHGNPDYANDCLTELGHRQAEAAAHRLQRESITMICSSPLGRARQTAEHTASLLQLPVTQLDFMEEIAWGRPGETYHEKYHPWLAGQRLTGDGIDLLSFDYEKDPFWDGTDLVNGVRTVATGLDRWLAEIGYEREGAAYRCTRENRDTAALFAHGGSSAAAMSHLLNLPMLYFCSVTPIIEFTSISIFDFSGKAGEFVVPRLELFNDHGHL